MKVLVVEDEIALLELYKEEIEFDCPNVEVLTATNGVEGLELCSQIAVDMIITDCRMPELDGVKMAERLKGSGIPIYMLTGHSHMYEPAYIKEQGVLEIFSKPVDFNEILRIIKNSSN